MGSSDQVAKPKKGFLCCGKKKDEDEEVFEICYPELLQMSYPAKVVTYHVEDIKKIMDTERTYDGTDRLCDAEHYVDSGITMSKRQSKTFHIQDQNKKYHETNAKIWTHVDANISKIHYYIYQDWWWDGISNQSSRRNFSFLGFFRKFSEADLMELIRLKQFVRVQKTILQIESPALFCDFFGKSVFDIFFSEIDFLEKVLLWLK